MFHLSSKSVYENIMSKYYIPKAFTYLSDINPSIVQDIRNSKNYNILGKPLDGYETNECILTIKAAEKLSEVQKELNKFANSENLILVLKVFECYRPRIANEQIFFSLIQKKNHFRKLNFYPNLFETDLIAMGFIEKNSAFSRGSTVAVTLSNNRFTPIFTINEDSKGIDCTGDFDKRFMFDFGIDMGTNYECLDKKSFENSTLTYKQQTNRKLLKILMENHGFVQNSKFNWWEFILKEEPFNETSFNFPIGKRMRYVEKGYSQFKGTKNEK